ncbi:MAG: HlyD family efflux transporter periplasmic adaptor subunit [Planctomycetota bacterium]
MTVVLVLGLFLILFAPWQQSVRGTGEVIAFKPGERMQTLQAPTKGRLETLPEGIYENAHVKKGQVIAEIKDLDEGYLQRLTAGLRASEGEVAFMRDQVSAANRNLVAAKELVTTNGRQLDFYKSLLDSTVATAEAQIDVAKNKLKAEKQKLIEADAALDQFEADFQRQKTLYEDGIASQLKYQQAEQKYLQAQAKVEQANHNIEAAESELISKTKERQAKEEKAQTEIEYSQSQLDKAKADVAKSESAIAKAEADLQKAEKALLEAENKLARQSSQIITAPFDGFLTKIFANQGSAILKEGDPIAEIVPDTKDRAVQIWLDGNDAPLVDVGRHVRLQFEGWPAVQFAGWPSVAVGTFGGEVVSVDATDNGKGKFRVLVRPDPDAESLNPHDRIWPNERYLRQGVRSNGWVLLEKVPLWYEIWRNMNGFPESIDPDEATGKTKLPKAPKLPKA